MESIDFTRGRAALVVAHPGHELRVYGWALAARPQVFVLTDGSGHTGRPRLDSTTKVLEQIGAERGCIYGRLTDREVYSAIMGRELPLFVALAEELAEALLVDEIEYVVGDASEGYNPAHDVCRLVIDAAVEIAGRARGRPLPNFDVLMAGAPGDYPEESFESAIRLRLDEDVLARKLEAARSYIELTREVEDILRKEGTRAVGIECLRHVTARACGGFAAGVPHYESYGEKQVAAGLYERVLRYGEHFAPLAWALRRYLDGRG